MKNGLIHAMALGAALLAAACTAETPDPDSAPAADDAAIEQALAIAASDPTLNWGPCPEIFPGECNIAVLHGDPAAPNADAFLRAGPQFAFPAHWHTSPERMILVAGELQVTYQGQPMATVQAGNYAYGPARLPHSATCVSATPCILFIAFESAVDAHAFEGSLD